jgi:hypothetical protein
MTPGNSSRRDSGMSLAWAEFLSYWGNWTLIVALLVGLTATYAVVVSGNVKEAALKREVAEAGAVAATAKANAATATTPGILVNLKPPPF